MAFQPPPPNSNGRLPCPECRKDYLNESTLEQHLRNQHPDSPTAMTLPPLDTTIRFPCPYCPTTFSHEFNVQAHINSQHLNLKTFLCPTCPYGNARAHVVRNHQAAFSHYYKYQCPMDKCVFGADTRDEIYHHLASSRHRLPQMEIENIKSGLSFGKWFRTTPPEGQPFKGSIFLGDAGRRRGAYGALSGMKDKGKALPTHESSRRITEEKMNALLALIEEEEARQGGGEDDEENVAWDYGFFGIRPSPEEIAAASYAPPPVPRGAPRGAAVRVPPRDVAASSAPYRPQQGVSQAPPRPQGQPRPAQSSVPPQPRATQRPGQSLIPVEHRDRIATPVDFSNCDFQNNPPSVFPFETLPLSYQIPRAPSFGSASAAFASFRPRNTSRLAGRDPGSMQPPIQGGVAPQPYTTFQSRPSNRMFYPGPPDLSSRFAQGRRESLGGVPSSARQQWNNGASPYHQQMAPPQGLVQPNGIQRNFAPPTLGWMMSDGRFVPSPPADTIQSPVQQNGFVSPYSVAAVPQSQWGNSTGFDKKQTAGGVAQPELETPPQIPPTPTQVQLDSPTEPAISPSPKQKQPVEHGQEDGWYDFSKPQIPKRESSQDLTSQEAAADALWREFQSPDPFAGCGGADGMGGGFSEYCAGFGGDDIGDMKNGGDDADDDEMESNTPRPLWNVK